VGPVVKDDRREALRKTLPPVAPTGGTFAWQFFLPAPAVPGWRIAKTLTPASRGARRERRHFLTVAPGEVVEVLSLECPSATDAREAVLDHLCACASPSFEAGGKIGYDFGEASWGGPEGPGGLAVFVRGNVAVVVRRAVGSPNVQAVARWTDELLAVRPGPSERQGPTAPALIRLESGQILGERKRALALEARDPLKRPVWWQLFVDGGRLERGETGLVLTTTATEATVEAFCLNENAHWTRGRLVSKG
jgi:hypothetical protein